MSQLVNFNNTGYNIPTAGETGWATPVTALLADLAANTATQATAQNLTNKTLAFSQGTAAGPSISFTGDPNTGLFQPAPDQVAIATAGVTRLTVDASGNVTATTPPAGDSSTKLATTAWTHGNRPATLGRNLLHNPMFSVVQRGAGPWTLTAAYTADRWQQNFVNGSMSTSVIALADADRTAIGDEQVRYALQAVVTGTSGASDYASIVQGVEGVERLAGKTVTFTGWAKASAGTPKLGVSMDQSFGTGGSPSANANGNGQSTTLSTTWSKFSFSITVPSMVGKTFGTTANTSLTYVYFWLSAGANSATRSGTVGVQSATIQLAQVQLEIGSATPFERRDLSHDLLLCQRYYQIGAVNLIGYNVAGQSIGFAINNKVTMRIAPTVAWTSGPSYTNAGSAATSNLDINSFFVAATVTGTGGAQVSAGFSLSADF